MNLELGKKIAVLRKVQKRTQTELAEYLSVQPQTVSRWEVEGGTPDVSLLPKIALFFGVTLDELFGMTDMEQIDNLVYKYSVLRDEKSFEEVMRSLDIGINSLEEELRSDKGNKEARQKREQLLAWKVHIYIQKSRKAKEDAENILDSLMGEVTEPDNPLYQALRLQKQQFRIQSGEGTAVIKEAKRIWDNDSSVENLYCYMAALFDMNNGAEILRLWEEDNVQMLVSDITPEVASIWQIMFGGAVTECNLSFFKKYFSLFEKNASAAGLFEARWELAKLYKALESHAEKERCKTMLLQEVESISLNEYLKDYYVKKINEL